MSRKRPPSNEPFSVSKTVKLEERGSIAAKNKAGGNVSSVKSVKLKDIKKDLKSLMSVHAENSGDFATGGLLSDPDLPNIPLIDIKNFGLLPTPLTKLYFDSVKQHCQDSPYGLGEETIIDKSVRNSIQLNPDMFEITNEIFAAKISQLINDKIKRKLGLTGANIYGKLYKLLIYESGGKFDEHRDTEKDDNMFGTLIIQLPSVFTGGNIVIKHNKKVNVYENSQTGSSTHCVYVAHYSSCPHTLKKVTSGYRVALIYSLCWDGNGMKPSPYVASTNTVKLCNLLNQYMDSPRATYISWALEYEYSDASLTTIKGAPSFFKGADKNVFSGLIGALAYDKRQYGKDRYELYIATANKHVEEGGDCDNYYGGCHGNCDGNWEVMESDVSLEEFVPLTETSLNAENIKTSFSPHHDLINSYSIDEDEFWGSAHEDSGCSGPSGNEGSTRERWYKKKVLILWRSDRALAIKCKANISDGVDHILELVKQKDFEEAKNGVNFIWPSISELNEVDMIHLIQICTALKRKDSIRVLFTNMQRWGISSENSGKVIGEAAKQFFSKKDDNLKDLKELLKKCKKKQTPNILHCCNLVPSLQPIEVIQILAQFTFKDVNSGYYGSYSYGMYSRSTQEDHEVTLLIEYMFQKNIFPEQELKLILNGITSLPSLSSLISVVIAKKDVIVINQLITRFVELASSKTSKELHESLKNIIEMITLFQSHHKLETTGLLLDRILPVISDSNIMIDFVEGHMYSNKQEKVVLKRLVHRYTELTFNKAPVNCKSSELSGVKRKGDTIKLAYALRKKKNFECLDILINGILSHSDNNQAILQELVAHVTSKNKENLPDCLMKACRARLTHLEGVALKGKPAMSWNQPDAIVPDHPRVQEFLRGPREKLAYKNFGGLPAARTWTNKHRASGCYMKVTLGSGIGKNAYVEIIKTTQPYEKLLSVYNQEIVEYKRLVNVVPGYSDVTSRVANTTNSLCNLSKRDDVIMLD